MKNLLFFAAHYWKILLYPNWGEWLCDKKWNYSFNRLCDLTVLFISQRLQYPLAFSGIYFTMKWWFKIWETWKSTLQSVENLIKLLFSYTDSVVYMLRGMCCIH
jgi:hypothetical protein